MNDFCSKTVFMLGGGGHASVLMDILRQNNIVVSGLFAPNIDPRRAIFFGIPCFDNEDEILGMDRHDVILVNGIGFVPGQNTRDAVCEKFKSSGFKFLNVTARSAEISNFAKIGSGVQVLPGAIIQAGAIIEDDTIINTRAIVEHDCFIGQSNHLAPSSTICGGVKTGSNVFIGSNATVLPGCVLKDNEIISAGSVR